MNAAIYGLVMTLTEPPSPEAAPVRSIAEAIAVPADDACLSRGLSEPVSTWLGRSEVRADLTVEVKAEEGAVGFVLLRSGEVRVERMLSPAPTDCADRRAALGLAIAMAVDAAVLEALAPPAEPEPAPPPVEPRPPTEPIETETAPAPPEPEPVPPEDPRRLRVAASAEGSVLLGALPRAAFGGELGIELGWISWLDVRIAGGGAGGLSTPLADGRVDAWMAWGAAELCPGRTFGHVRLRLCAGVAAGALQARGRGFTINDVVTEPWVSARTGGELDVGVSERVALRGRATLLTPVVRTRLDVRDAADQVIDVRDPALAGAQLGLGVVVRLAGPNP